MVRSRCLLSLSSDMHLNNLGYIRSLVDEIGRRFKRKSFDVCLLQILVFVDETRLGADVKLEIWITMEDDMLSMISNGGVNATAEDSDSSSTTYPFPESKRARHGSNASSKFKGVVPQQNGHWGAQIYANHQRIWLGTFKTEKEAAMAYDSAAIKLRSGDSQRNFPWTDITVEEPSFQNLYSTEAVLNMIKEGSYQSKFEDFLRTHSHIVETIDLNLGRVQSKGGLSCKQLFQKELTPSDVGSLNRLVIPKKFAVKYFPCISESAEDNEGGGNKEAVQLIFYDRMMRSWKFRYCYWKSSQSFVFTRGWNRFVKEKKLKANDTISFYLCECQEAANDARSFNMIDVNSSDNCGGLVEQANQYVGIQMDLKLGVSPQIDHKLGEEKELKGPKPTHETEKPCFRLFGVQII
uniref:AP2/ERF and B3 domain-containing transcription factor n=2 Tax=Quercus lobata TaxID=97700 RepID=A0A7N2L1V3_QUELO